MLQHCYPNPATTTEIYCTLKISPISPKSMSQNGDILERTLLKMIFCLTNFINVLLKYLFSISFCYSDKSKIAYVVRGNGVDFT